MKTRFKGVDYTHPISYRVWASKWKHLLERRYFELSPDSRKVPWWSEKWRSNALVRRWSVCLYCSRKQVPCASARKAFDKELPFVRSAALLPWISTKLRVPTIMILSLVANSAPYDRLWRWVTVLHSLHLYVRKALSVDLGTKSSKGSEQGRVIKRLKTIISLARNRGERLIFVWLPRGLSAKERVNQGCLCYSLK